LLDYIRRLKTFGSFSDLEFDIIALRQGLKTLILNRGKMNEDIVATIMLDETIPFVVVEPLYFTYRQASHHLSTGKSVAAIKMAGSVPSDPCLSFGFIRLHKRQNYIIPLKTNI